MRTPENARPLYPACRILLILLACGLTGCASLLPPKGKARVEPRPYNVLWLTSESMNVKHLGCYGYPLEKETSPHLDNFAKTAVRFETCMTASAWTSENMVSYFTGINSLVHKVHARNHHTPPEWYTPMEILRDYGYAIPRLSGYQADVNYNHLGFEANVTPMFPTDWLEANKDKRFFIWHHFLSPHLPYAPKHIARKKFWKDEYVPNAESRKRIDFVEKQGVVVKGSVEFIPEEDTIPMHALYDGGVHRMDYEFLVVMRKLEELGLRENTIVIFSADHGEELLEHGFVGHASTSKHAQLYDEILHIPLMISLPGRIPQNLVISQQVRAIDIMPTIFDLLELPIPEYMEGRSLLPLMENRKPPSPAMPSSPPPWRDTRKTTRRTCAVSSAPCARPNSSSSRT